MQLGRILPEGRLKVKSEGFGGLAQKGESGPDGGHHRLGPRGKRTHKQRAVTRVDGGAQRGKGQGGEKQGLGHGALVTREGSCPFCKWVSLNV